MDPGTAITIKDVADLLFAARGRIDFYWNFYVLVVIAVVGWLVSLKKALTLPMKLLVSVAYLIAATTNFVGLYGSYTFAEALRIDLLRMAADTPLSNTRLILEEHSYLLHGRAALWVHIALGVPILLIVWFARFSEVEGPTRKKTAGTAQEHNAHAKQHRRSVFLKAVARAFGRRGK